MPTLISVYGAYAACYWQIHSKGGVVVMKNKAVIVILVVVVAAVVIGPGSCNREEPASQLKSFTVAEAWWPAWDTFPDRF